VKGKEAIIVQIKILHKTKKGKVQGGKKGKGVKEER